MIWHVPPKPVSVPHMTSSWATNGLNHMSASGGRRVSASTGFSSRAAGWSGRNPLLPVIAVQKMKMNAVPAVRKMTATRLMTVAAWVRRTSADTNRPIAP